ncbi:MAG: COX15/CtaA family protein, partial [Chromatiales bacterium]|nr:COX15/CtaA family protein [Chromatiales bacterium]
MPKRLPTVLVNLSIILTLAVVLLGGWTRVNDAGLSCPDWPGCYGEYVIPGTVEQQQSAQMRYPEYPMDIRKGWIEMVHRYFAGSLGVLIGCLALVAWRQPPKSGYPVMLSWLLFGFVILQGLFGMWTVTLKLQPLIVVLHLLGGLVTLSLLIRLRQRVAGWQQERVLQTQIPRWWLRIAVILLFGQIALGGWTSANYSRWACSHWIACDTQGSVELDYVAGFTVWQPLGPNYQGGRLDHKA